MSYAAASSLQPTRSGFRANLGEGWDIFGITNGGYTLSILGRAMGKLTEGRRLISISGHFPNPATAGPVDITTQLIKEGRSLATSTATMLRDGRPLLIATSVHTSGEGARDGVELVYGTAPELPPPEVCVRAQPAVDAPLPPPMMGKVDVRIHPDDAVALQGEPSGTSLMRGWFRLLEDEPLDPYAVVMAADAFPPPVFNSGLPIGWTPTVDLSVHIHNHRPEGWLACRFTTSFITDGLAEEDGEIWDSRGRPVAFSRQLALVSG